MGVGNKTDEPAIEPVSAGLEIDPAQIEGA